MEKEEPKEKILMKELIRRLLIESLEESEKTKHISSERYPERIENSSLKDMDPKFKIIIDERIAFIETLDFDEKSKFGIWLLKTPEMVTHHPYRNIDRGNLLLLVVATNKIATLVWAISKKGDYDYSISYEDLVRFTESEYYNPKKGPITVKVLRDFLVPKEPKIERETYKKIKLNDGTEIRYYKNLNKFETIDGKEIKVDDIFEKLPNEIQKYVLDSL